MFNFSYYFCGNDFRVMGYEFFFRVKIFSF